MISMSKGAAEEILEMKWKDFILYSTAQKKAALHLYGKTGNASAVVRQLGFPGSTKTLYRWRNARCSLPRKRSVYLTPCEKQQLVDRVQSGQRVRDVAAIYDVTEQTAYSILRGHSRGNEVTPMNPSERVKHDDLPDDVDELKRRCQDLQFENDLMREVVELVKKDRGVNLESLTDALRPMYSLNCLTGRFGIAPSSYHYAHEALARPDKYADVRRVVSEIFMAAGGTRGYRYVT
jgi:putative transposase